MNNRGKAAKAWENIWKHCCSSCRNVSYAFVSMIHLIRMLNFSETACNFFL